MQARHRKSRSVGEAESDCEWNEQGLVVIWISLINLT